MDALFELGLFMGHLGRERTFVVHPSGESVKIPSDLAGLTTAPYQWPRGDGNHQAWPALTKDASHRVGCHP